MKRILLTSLTCIAFMLCTTQIKAQTVTFDNQTSTYFIGVFLTSCTSTTTNFYYDVPNNYTYTQTGIIDESGSNISPSDAFGIALSDYSGGTGTYYVSFCDASGTQQATGSTLISAPGGSIVPGFVVVVWSIAATGISITLL